MTRRRWALLCAAPPAFYLAASLILFIGMMVWGGPVFTRQQQIATVIAGSPAQAAGLHIGDVLVSIDGENTDLDHPPALIIDRGQGRPVRVVFERGGASQELLIAPRFDRGHWMLGLQLMPLTSCERVPISAAARVSLLDPARRVVGVVNLVKAAWGRRADVFGPVAMARGLSAPKCTLKLQGIIWIETPFALCSAISLLVLIGFAINSVRRARASSRLPQ